MRLSYKDAIDAYFTIDGVKTLVEKSSGPLFSKLLLERYSFYFIDLVSDAVDSLGYVSIRRCCFGRWYTYFYRNIE